MGGNEPPGSSLTNSIKTFPSSTISDSLNSPSLSCRSGVMGRQRQQSSGGVRSWVVIPVPTKPRKPLPLWPPLYVWPFIWQGWLFWLGSKDIVGVWRWGVGFGGEEGGLKEMSHHPTWPWRSQRWESLVLTARRPQEHTYLWGRQLVAPCLWMPCLLLSAPFQTFSWFSPSWAPLLASSFLAWWLHWSSWGMEWKCPCPGARQSPAWHSCFQIHTVFPRQEKGSKMRLL